MKLLFISDDSSAREKYLHLFRSLNFSSQVFRSFSENPESVVASESPQFIVVDAASAKVNVLDTCRRLRSLPDAEPFYLIVALKRDDEAQITDYLRSGADDYLIIPFTEPQVSGRIMVGGKFLSSRLQSSSRLALTAQNEHAELINCAAAKVFDFAGLIGSAVKQSKVSPVRNLAGQVTHLPSVQRDIALEKQKEASLREARRYEQFFNLVNDAVIVFDPHSFKVLLVNNKACEIYRTRREAFIGQCLTSFWLDAERERETIRKLLDDGKIERFETEHARADNAKMNVQISSSLVEYEGAPAILSIKRDVTERRRVELGIKRARQEWTETVDAVSDMIILEDPDGNLRRCNRATSEFFKLSYTDLIGRPLSSLIETGGDSASFEFSKIRHLREPHWEGQLSGRPNWYEITNHPVPTGIEGKCNWVHIIQDITERKHAEAERHRLYTAIEQAADAILITNPVGLIQYVNSAFERQTGWSRSETVGREISEVKHGLRGYEPLDEIFAVLTRGEMWQKTYRAVRKNGENYDEQATASLVRSGAGNLLNYVFVCRDVTETRRLESIAEAVNMMDNVGYIFSGIRHELGNPINSIKTALTVLKQNLGHWQNERVELYIERCLTETARVEYLLRTLKTFSMHENPQMQAVALTDFMKKFVSLIYEDFAQRNIKITLAGAENIGEALCDPRALHQVMLNLLTNSADAFESDREAEIVVSLAREKNRIYVRVDDNGVGISQSQMSNLFKPFYTSKAKGNGLGLVIVRSMLGKMNGTISIESTPNVGTGVTFTLEAANAEI